MREQGDGRRICVPELVQEQVSCGYLGRQGLLLKRNDRFLSWHEFVLPLLARRRTLLVTHGSAAAPGGSPLFRP
jgi:hypothetical protein